MNVEKILQKSSLKATKEVKLKNYDLHEHLPVVKNFCVNHMDREIFKDTDILFIQHFLSPFIFRLKMMEEYGGGKFENFWFVDIPYSTNHIVKNEITKFCNKENFAHEHKNALDLYTITQKSRVEDVLRKIAENDHKLLIVDDGAYAVRTLVDMEMKEPKFVEKFCKRKVSIVEQTTRGHRIFTENKDSKLYLEFLKRHKISVVSIARTKTKSKIESPFIGISVSNAILEKFKELQDKGKRLEKILILGFGPVGKATTKALLNNKEISKQIHVSEPEDGLRNSINKLKAKHVPILSDSFFGKKSNQNYDIVIGCTGYGSFLPKDIKILSDGGILASGSSASVEFNRAKFIEKVKTDDRYQITNLEKIKDNGIRSQIDMKRDEKTFSFLNAGFPVNFDGQIECIDPKIIQFTHGLLVAASKNSILAEPGFEELHRFYDDWIFKESLRELEKYSK